MPLARGSAAVGYMTLLAVFMAADMPITARIPTVHFAALSPPPTSTCQCVDFFFGCGAGNMLALATVAPSINISMFSRADECVLVQSYQPDWEAILSRSPRDFIASVSKWLYPAAAHASSVVSSGGTGPTAPCTKDVSPETAAVMSPLPALPLDELPVVGDILGTLRARLEALNGPKDPQIHTL